MAMSDGEATFWAGCFVGFIVCVGVFLYFDGGEIRDLKQEAIKRGAAQYNPVSGDWEWTAEPVAEAKE